MAELKHHGILGQKWGVRNGPPYPLDEIRRSAKEKSAEKGKKLYDSGKRLKDIGKENFGFNLSQALIGLGSLPVAGILAGTGTKTGKTAAKAVLAGAFGTVLYRNIAKSLDEKHLKDYYEYNAEAYE